MTMAWQKKHKKHYFKVIPRGEEVPEEEWEAQQLFYRVTDLSKYFEDMMFAKGTPTYEMLSVTDISKLAHMQNRREIPFDLDDCEYIVKPIRGKDGKFHDGKFNSDEFSLTITPRFFPGDGSVAAEPEQEEGKAKDEAKEKARERDNAILHEMIHMYECVLDNYTDHGYFYREILLYCLYRDLSKNPKVSNLDKIIHQKGNMANLKRLWGEGGEHDLLFLLKSIDLDWRVGVDIGTIFSY